MKYRQFTSGLLTLLWLLSVGHCFAESIFSHSHPDSGSKAQSHSHSPCHHDAEGPVDNPGHDSHSNPYPSSQHCCELCESSCFEFSTPAPSVRELKFTLLAKSFPSPWSALKLNSTDAPSVFEHSPNLIQLALPESIYSLTMAPNAPPSAT